MTITQPLKWHGGKHYLAKRIVALMPRHLHYVEPYAGGLSVLLERDPNDPALWLPGHKGVSEVANDINGDLMNFWKVLQHPAMFEQFKREVQAIPLSHPHFRLASNSIHEGSVTRAIDFFIRARQSRAGTFKGFTQLTRSRLRRGINGNASEWLGAVDGLPGVHARLQPVVLESDDALEIIQREDSFETLFYLDPPYLHETRVAKDAYAFEMTESQHNELLGLLARSKGKFMLSGYRSDLYCRWAIRRRWNCHEFEIPNHAAGGKSKRVMTECIWTNF